MKLSLYVAGIGAVTLTDKNFVGGGGEADVYTKDNIAFKIYHDPTKMIPVAKIRELQGLTPKNVMKPQNIIHQKKNKKEVGYTMPFKKGTTPLCKLFAKSFKGNNGISEEDIVNVVTAIQKTVAQIHKDGFVIVDLNEMNILLSSSFKTPYFIDVDSYQTPSYKATAIMESIRDPLVKNNQFTALSDWFSFAIIAFQLYIGIHPYKGKHPNYKPNEWLKRMEDGISVFDPNVSLPRVCNDFSVIPSSHMEWFKAVFLRNERCEPPMPDEILVIAPAAPTFAESDETFEVDTVATYPANILAAFNFMGVNYVVTSKKLYKEKKELPHDIEGFKTLLCESADMSPIVCKLKNGELTFEDMHMSTVGRTNAIDMMYKAGAIYSLYDGKIFEHTFDQFGSKMIHKMRVACNALENATKIFDGVIFQNLIGKWHITLPYEQGKCLFKPVPELDGFRVLEARAEGNICGVMAECKGKYHRFTLTFDKNFLNYQAEVVKDVDYGPINLTVLTNGLCVSVADGEARLCMKDKGKVVADPPFDATTRLFNVSGGVYFIDKRKIHSVKMKK